MQTNRLNTGWEHYKGTLGGVWEVWRGEKLKNHFNVPWQQVELPHTYNAHDTADPDKTYYQGPGWYRKNINVANPYQDGRTLLHFEGVGHKTDVFVYTDKVGSHIGGYDEFTVDITDKIANEQKAQVAIRCDNSRDLEMIPSDISDFNLYGGLYRYLNLVYVPAISIKNVFITPNYISPDKAEAPIEIELYNPDKLNNDLEIEVVLTDDTGEYIGSKLINEKTWDGKKNIATFMIDAPKLWSPDHPNLYYCQATLTTSKGQTQVTNRFGIRFFEFVKNGPFYLNGERLLIRGTHRHEEHAGVGCAMTEEQIQAELQMIKEMGANFVRLGHYQQSRIVLEACDELGLLVWEEIPWCRGGFGGLRYQKQLRDMLTSLIEQHYNHPSIIIWGLGNENDWAGDFEEFDKHAIRQMMQQLNDLAHTLDSSRKTGIRRCEFCRDVVDIYSPSIWAGWYRGIYTEYEKYTKEQFNKVDHFLHLEWGADSLAGRHVEEPFTGFEEIATGQGADERDGDYMISGGDARISKDGDWSETYFCDLVDWHLKCQEKMDWLPGTVQWVFKDYCTPLRPDNPLPYMNVKGVVQRDLTKKESYYVFQSYWTAKPMIHIYGHNAKVRWGSIDEFKTIKVYSNCEQVELIVNGENLGSKQRNSQDFPAAGLRWDVLLNEGMNDVEAIAEQNGIVVKDSLQVYYQTATWQNPAKLVLSSENVCKDRFFIQVKAVDKNGVLCADATNFVRFELAGDGQLIDSLGIVNGANYLQLNNGHAGIYTEISGDAVVSASAKDIKTEFLQIFAG